MKIYFALRLYTGLEFSVNNKKWTPTGIPTIYKLLETLEKKHQIKVNLFQKTSEAMQFSDLNSSKSGKVKFEEFKNSFYIFSKFKISEILGKKINKVFEEIHHTIRIIINIIKFKPEIIYVDNANIWAGGIIARIFSRPVVLRVLGVYPQTRTLYNNKNLSIIKKIFKWCYRAPYSLVINTDDGSNGHDILVKLLKPNTNNVLLLNGVDIPKNNSEKVLFPDFKLSNSVLKCLFIGKLEVYKGCITFVDTIMKAIDLGMKNIHAIIIGIGSEKKNILKKIKLNKKEKYFTILGNISHKDIFYFHYISDLYISLNSLGNFSNVNLEAIKYGQVIVLPKSLPLVDNKKSLDKVLSIKGALWIKDPSDIKGLLQIIKNIYDDREKLKKHKNAAKKNLNKIPSWTSRIKKEIKLLEDLV